MQFIKDTALILYWVITEFCCLLHYQACLQFGRCVAQSDQFNYKLLYRIGYYIIQYVLGVCDKPVVVCACICVYVVQLLESCIYVYIYKQSLIICNIKCSRTCTHLCMLCPQAMLWEVRCNESHLYGISRQIYDILCKMYIQIQIVEHMHYLRVCAYVGTAV